MADMDTLQASTALRRIARGFDELARAITDEPATTRNERAEAAMTEWGDRGLSQGQASELFKRHGLSPQTSGGWARGNWIETQDGLRYLTQRSFEWLDKRSGNEKADGPF